MEKLINQEVSPNEIQQGLKPAEEWIVMGRCGNNKLATSLARLIFDGLITFQHRDQSVAQS